MVNDKFEKIAQHWFSALPTNERKKYYTCLTKVRNKWFNEDGKECRRLEHYYMHLYMMYRVQYLYAEKLIEKWAETQKWRTC